MEFTLYLFILIKHHNEVVRYMVQILLEVDRQVCVLQLECTLTGRYI